MEIIIIIIEKYPVHVRSLPLSYCDGGSLPVSLEHLLHPSPIVPACSHALLWVSQYHFSISSTPHLVPACSHALLWVS